VLANNANDAWTAAAIETACARVGEAPEGSVLVVDCEVPAALVTRALLAAGRKNMYRVLDPSFPSRVDSEMLRSTDAITPNVSEVRALRALTAIDSDDLLEIARGLVPLGPRTVCVKLEDGGCLQVSAHGHAHVGAPANIKVVDTTGAGDAFTGAFAVAMLEGRPVSEATRFAVAASSLAVTRYGSQPAYPRRAALEELMHCGDDPTGR
jgi:ribokinase